MKSRLPLRTRVLMATVLLTATSAMAENVAADAQAQAAALLSRPQTFETVRVDSFPSRSAATDAHATAAALLSHPSTKASAQTAASVSRVSRTASADDAQAKAAALLSRPRTS